MPLASLLLLAVLAAPARAVPVAVSTAPVAVSTRAYALPDLVAQVQNDGEGAVLTDPLASQIGVDDPTTTKVLHYPEGSDRLVRSVYVSQKQHPLKTGEETRPQFVIFVTELTTRGAVERHYLRLDDAGKLEQVTVIRDTLDDQGVPVPGEREVTSTPLKKGQEWLDHEDDFYFHGKYRKPREAP